MPWWRTTTAVLVTRNLLVAAVWIPLSVSILEDDDEDDPFEQWCEYDLVLGEGLALDEDGQVVEVY